MQIACIFWLHDGQFRILALRWLPRDPAYVDLDVRLQELIEHKNDANADIEAILLELEKLCTDVDDVGEAPHRVGLRWYYNSMS